MEDIREVEVPSVVRQMIIVATFVNIKEPNMKIQITGINM